MEAVIFKYFWGGFWGFRGSLVNFSLVIGLITYSVYDLLYLGYIIKI